MTLLHHILDLNCQSSSTSKPPNIENYIDCLVDTLPCSVQIAIYC
jgi:hypothetical protein